MSPEIRTALYTAACACDEAGIASVARYLQTIAGMDGADDRTGRGALNAAVIASLAVWSERTGSSSRDAAARASHAGNTCRDLLAETMADDAQGRAA